MIWTALLAAISLWGGVELEGDDLKRLALFEENFTEAKRVSKKIPKVLHFIWLGPRPFPKHSWANVARARELHPDWKVMLWADAPDFVCPIDGVELRSIELGKWEKFFYETENQGERSDLLRYAILEREGGVYLDHDVALAMSLDSILERVSFFGFLEPLRESLTLDTQFTVTNCMIGSAPGERLFGELFSGVARRWEKYKALYPGRDSLSETLRVLNRTFDPFSLVIEGQLGREDVLIFPPQVLFSSYIDEVPEGIEKVGDHLWEGTWAQGDGGPRPVTPRFDIVKITKKGMRKIVKQVESIFFANLLLFLTLVTAYAFSFRKQRARLYSSRRGDGRGIPHSDEKVGRVCQGLPK